jgi:hypothetical protein
MFAFCAAIDVTADDGQGDDRLHSALENDRSRCRVRAVAEGNFSRVIGRDGDIMDRQKQ